MPPGTLALAVALGGEPPGSDAGEQRSTNRFGRASGARKTCILPCGAPLRGQSRQF
jgi:hypothetical protein